MPSGIPATNSRIILRLWLMVMLWVCIESLPQLAQYRNEELFFRARYQELPAELFLYLNLLQLPVLALFSLVWIFLFSTTRTLFQTIQSEAGRKVISLCTLSISSLFVFYVMTINLSWYIRPIRGSFISFSDLSLTSYLLNFKALSAASETTDLWTITRSLALGIGALGITKVVLHRTEGLFLCATSFTLAMLTILILFGFRLEILSKLTEEKKYAVRSAATSYLSPHMSLLEDSYLFGSSPPQYFPENLNLKPRPVSLRNSDLKIPNETQPNIIIIVVEALRADVIGQTKGLSIMPFTQQLADEGISFSHAYSHGAETDYSTLALLTGTYTLKYSDRNLNINLDYPITRLYDLLHDSGYSTSAILPQWWSMSRVLDSTKLDLNVDPSTLATHELLKELPTELSYFKQYDAELNDLFTIERLKRWIAETDHNRPFFSYVYLYGPHFAYLQPKSIPQRFFPNNLPEGVSFLNYPEEDAGTLKNRYYNSLQFSDSLIRNLIGFLDLHDLTKNTVVVITGDHGQFFHEHGLVGHGRELYEEAIRVPLIFSGPVQKLTRIDSNLPVSHINIAPTLLDIAGLPAEKSFQGLSLLDPSISTQPIYATVQSFSYEDCAILWPWKYCINYRRGERRLNQLEIDPNELNNLVGKNVEAEVSLNHALANYRNRQLFYYSPQYSKRYDYYPPQFDREEVTSTTSPLESVSPYKLTERSHSSIKSPITMH